jgi:hypothetical protein
MMDDVVVGDIVEEEATLPSQKVSVDGCSSSTLEVPFLASVVRELRVSMVEICNHDDCDNMLIILESYGPSSAYTSEKRRAKANHST